MDKIQTSELLAIMAEAYRSTWRKSENRQEVEKQIAIWMRYTEDLGYGEAISALDRLISSRTSAFAPTIGEIRREVMRARFPSLLISAEDAWGEVWTAVKAKGLNGKPEWSHPALAAAVESIGWRELCTTNTDQLGTLRAQFMRIYESKREHCEAQEAVPESIRIMPPKPASPLLQVTHSTRPALAAIPSPKKEEPEASPETSAENFAKLKAILDIKVPQAEQRTGVAMPVLMSEDQYADPNWLPKVGDGSA